jgi:eukaryotic-like serine/threonine-protein kinase
MEGSRSMIPEVGQRFGPYEILGRLGGGGMGLVFRAWDERLHRKVAIKLLHNNYMMPGMRERFLQEARAASGLNHPNICTIFDIGEQVGDPYLVMELLEGETLKGRIARGALTAEEIVRFGSEIASALAVAHANGIVHRDIKPANIFLVTTPNGRSQAKVLDFGLAKINLEVHGGWASRALDLTMEGATVGTLAYMSPEQARGESLDARSDLFSLGIVMYEMATRRVPFKGTTSAVVFMELFNHAPEPLRIWNESIPRELERVILKLLTKDRRGRFQTADELRDALTRLSGKLSSRLGRRRWSSRGLAAVPLVHAPDPVARYKHPQRRPVRLQGEAIGQMLAAAEPGSISSANKRAIHTGAIPESEFDRDLFYHGERQSAPAVDRGAMPVRFHALHGVPVQSDSSAAAAAARASKRAADNAIRQEQREDSARSGLRLVSRAGVMLVEDEVESVDAPDFIAEEWKREQASHSLAAAVGRLGRHSRVAVTVALLVAAAGGISLLVRSGLFRPVVLGPKDRLLLTVIQNRTGDKTLDGTVMEGVEIALRESASLDVLGGEAYKAGLRQIAAEGGAAATTVPEQSVAQKVGAKAYLYGEITGSGAPYTISVNVLRADSNDEMTSLEETAASREEIPAAIGRLAHAVREEVGEPRGAENVSLEQEATPNLNALHAYAVGESAMQDGRTGEALAAYREAAGLDPKFAQAQMRLAWLYREEKAEVASANAAELARDAAAHASTRVKLLAQFCYEINVSGDDVEAAAAIRQYVAKYPVDVEGMRGLARVLRLQGYLPEALQAAQQGYEMNPYDAETYTEAELAMIGMDRYDGALKLQARRMGVASSAGALTTGSQAAKNPADTDSSASAKKENVTLTTTSTEPATYAALDSQGLALDNAGRMAEGLELWRTAAANASQAAELGSTQASMLAQGALDRALTEDCTVALEMANEARSLPKGPIASFHAGMAAALCGDKTYADRTIAELQQSSPRSTRVAQTYVPELEAAAEIGVNEPAKALPILADVKVHDQMSLTPYLQGLAHAAVGQNALAIADFKAMLVHRGVALALGSNVYPMAEIGLARAYAADEDKADSVVAYRRFLSLWGDADQNQPRMREALAKSLSKEEHSPRPRISSLAKVVNPLHLLTHT